MDGNTNWSWAVGLHWLAQGLATFYQIWTKRPIQSLWIKRIRLPLSLEIIFYKDTVCFMHLQRRQEREERQHKGNVQYVTKDVGFTPATLCVPVLHVGPLQSAGRLQEVWICGLFFIGAARLGRTARKTKLEEKRCLGQCGLNYRVKWRAVYQRVLYKNIPPTWKTVFTS